MGKLRKIMGAFIHAPERFDELAERIARVNRRLDDLSGTVEGVDAEWLKKVADRLSMDSESLEMLNREMSVHRTVWGDPRRLRIAHGAAVESCLFNVNSGRIEIGEYTFAGPGVSLLAGGHDPELRGYLRRDAELRSGCDIVIGKGVWLASGCMLLGPCSIGDNSVIAAGAVVTPGTEVPANTIWGGVPAKQIGLLDSEQTGAAVSRALYRENGVLFIRGWSEKKAIPGRAESRRWLETNDAEILTDRQEIRMEFGLEGTEECTLILTEDGKETEIPLCAGTGYFIIHRTSGKKEPGLIGMRKKTDHGKLWIRYDAGEKEVGKFE